MKLVTAIVRPEKVMNVIKALEEEGYFAFGQFLEEAVKREFRWAMFYIRKWLNACFILLLRIRKRMK